MNTKYAALLLVAAFGLAIASFADEQRAPGNQTQTLKIKRLDGTIVELTHEFQTQTVKIKAHGESIAEFKVSTNKPVVIEGGVMVNANQPRFIGVKGGVLTIRINCAGEFPFIFKADEVEIVPEVHDLRKSPLLAD
jgi:hypothetical protein